MEEGRIGAGDSLHVTGNARIGHGVAVGRTGDGLPVSKAIGAFQHIRLRPMMRAEIGAASGGGGVSGCVLAGVMALHAQEAFAGVGNHSAIHEGHRGQGANQMHIVGWDGLAVRFMACLATNEIGRASCRERV